METTEETEPDLKYLKEVRTSITAPKEAHNLKGMKLKLVT